MKFLAIRNININFLKNCLYVTLFLSIESCYQSSLSGLLTKVTPFFLSNQSSWRSPLNEIKLRKTLTPYLDVSSAEVVY